MSSPVPRRNPKRCEPGDGTARRAFGTPCGSRPRRLLLLTNSRGRCPGLLPLADERGPATCTPDRCLAGEGSVLGECRSLEQPALSPVTPPPRGWSYMGQRHCRRQAHLTRSGTPGLEGEESGVGRPDWASLRGT